MKKVEPALSRMQHKFTRQRGASLLEGIAYLGIAAVVVLGAVSLLTNAFGSAKANQTTEELVALRTATRKLYAGQSYNDANLQTNLITANAIPNTLGRPTATTLGNSWGGAVTIVGAASLFTITYNNMPQDVCIAVVSGANGWLRITANAVAANDIATFPATTAQAIALCGNAGNNNTVAFQAA